MSHLLTHLTKNFVVSLLTFENSDTASFYPLPRSVAYHKGDKLGGSGLRRLGRIFSRFNLIGQTVEQFTPDVIISFMDTANIATLLSCCRREVPVIVSERVDPSQHDIGWARDLLRTCTYPLARLIVVPSSRVADHFPESLRSKIRIIGNPIPIPSVRARVGESFDRKRVIAVGRHELQKGFDLLLDAFALVADNHPDWDLVIIGDGPERPNLERRVQALDLQERIILKGTVRDVVEEMVNSHLMAFPSRYEGFPNALAEGLAIGLPAVGYKAVSGVEELIIDGQTGLLVDQREGSRGLACALARLLADENMRIQLGSAARRHVRRWAPDQIFALWEESLFEAARS